MPNGKSKRAANGGNNNNNRRRRQRQRIPRVVSDRSLSSVSAPIAMSQAMRTGRPVIYATAGGLRVVHAEPFHKLVLGAKDKQYVRSDALSPALFPWLKSIALAFNRFSFNEVRMYYIPRAGTTTRGEILMAPWYGAQAPAELALADSSGANGFAYDFIKRIEGAVSQSIWQITEDVKKKGVASVAEGLVGDAMQWAGRKAVRQFFNTIGMTVTLNAPYTGSNDVVGSDALIPGYLITGAQVSYDPDSSFTDEYMGDFWCAYDVALDDAVPSGHPLSLCLQLTGTDLATLDTDVAQTQITGNAEAFLIVGNTITFRSPGKYLIVLAITGSTPVADVDGHTLTGPYGGSTASFGSYLSAANQLTQSTQSFISGGYDAGDASNHVSVIQVDAEAGTKLTLDTLASGTYTAARILITEVSSRAFLPIAY